jgi:hypothetical protein
VVAFGLGQTGTDYFMNNKQDKSLLKKDWYVLIGWKSVSNVIFFYLKEIKTNLHAFSSKPRVQIY